MTITIEAIYEDGVLKPKQPLPLQEHARVEITIRAPGALPSAVEAVRRSYGLIGWSGAAASLRRVAQDPEFGSEESP